MRQKYLVATALSATAGLLLGRSSPKTSAPAAAAAARTTAPPPTGANQAAFESTIKPLFAKSCAPCHNERMASGSLNIHAFSNFGSIATQREQWERILQKIRT